MEQALRVANREVGKLPLSIGTALAIETLLATPKEWPSELWINLRTIIRNITSAMPNEYLNGTLGIDVYPTLLGELEFLIDHVYAETRTRTKVVFYHCSYADMNIKFPAATLRVATTPNQLDALALETTILDEFFAQNADPMAARMAHVAGTGRLSTGKIPIWTFSTDIRGDYTDILLMSHLPVDLLSAGSFKSMKLLESYTGKVKAKNEWTSKLTGGNKLLRIPFNVLTIQLFGDSSNHFASGSLVLKRIVLNLAEERKWTAVSSIELIESHVRSLPLPLAAAKTALLGMLRS